MPMRRADRLFRIVEYLKARRQAVTAESLAFELDVSVRTIYRDIADLSLSGVPIIGEAGVGYMMDKNYVLRPLMFEVDELDALMLGAQMVGSWGDVELAKSARKAIDKISAILPESLKAEMLSTIISSYPSQAKTVITIDFSALRKALRAKKLVEFHYTTEDNRNSLRRIRPLCLAFFGPVWVITGWCELRQDFRNFRLDRMNGLTITEDVFRHEKGKRLSDYEKIIKAEKNALK